MNSNRLLAFLMFFCGYAAILFAQNGKSLFVVADGVTTSVPLKEIKSIKYSNEQMIISSVDGALRSWDIVNVGNLIIYDTDVTSIERVGLGEIKFSGNALCVNAEVGTQLRIYNTAGHLVHSEELISPSSVINIAGWQKGLYIIKINDKTIKLQNR